MNQKLFAFTQRVAFICNIFFIGCLIMQYITLALPQFVVSVMLMLGWVLSPIMNVIAFVFFMFSILKGDRSTFPGFLIIINTFALFYQIFHFFFI
ncbi:MAG: hypothetical protein ABIY35_07010 [Chitinophagaceae bacterium]